MTDLLEAAQDALFAALKPIELMDGMPAGLKVYQHVPQDTEPPMIVLGDLSSANASNKGDDIEDITVEIQFFLRAPGRAPLLSMMRAVRGLLDGQPIITDGAIFETPCWLKSDASGLMGDGITYVGMTYFRFYAQPA